MLTALTISDLAIVDHLELDFKNGLSVITGETGAGKSILLGALALCIGDRADPWLLREGVSKAEVSASFQLTGQAEAVTWLQERSLDSEEIVLRRVISKDGRSRAYINGSMVTLADLRALGEMLIDIHSQHEHQTLLRRDSHLSMLDAYANTSVDALSLFQRYYEWRATAQQLELLTRQGHEQAAKLEFLRFQLDELERLALTENEVSDIEQEFDRLSHIDSRRHKAATALQSLEEDDNGGLCKALHRVRQVLCQAHTPELKEILDTLESADIQLKEASHLLRHYHEGLEANPARLAELDQRLAAIHQLARKHRVQADELPSLTEHLRNECTQLQQSLDLDTLQQRCHQQESVFWQLAQSLGERRRQAAHQFNRQVQENLHALGMANAQFEVSFVPLSQPNSTGLDDIEFLFSANPGQSMRPLGKVASGGELSRISLAIQVVNAQHSAIPVMVFDEVDVGISGGIAEVVGKLLRQLGTYAQVICITHQPQVAAQGMQHYRVEKFTDGQMTRSQVSALDHEQRVQEVARLSGGLVVTQETLRHARSLLESA